MTLYTLVNPENFNQFIGKDVIVNIACYEFGYTYPDDNILVGMNDSCYYFKSKTQGFWHFEKDSSEKCNVEVFHFNKTN